MHLSSIWLIRCFLGRKFLIVITQRRDRSASFFCGIYDDRYSCGTIKFALISFGMFFVPLVRVCYVWVHYFRASFNSLLTFSIIINCLIRPIMNFCSCAGRFDLEFGQIFSKLKSLTLFSTSFHSWNSWRLVIIIYGFLATEVSYKTTSYILIKNSFQ